MMVRVNVLDSTKYVTGKKSSICGDYSSDYDLTVIFPKVNSAMEGSKPG